MIYFKNPDTGLIEGLDDKGQVVTMQKSVDLVYDHATRAGFREVKRPDGEVIWVEDGVDIPVISSWYYNPMLGAEIASAVAAGASLSTLAKRGYPTYPVLARWLRVHADFKEMIEQAERDRAYLRFEEIQATAQETYDKYKDDPDTAIQAAKLKVESLKFLAEKGDKDKFGTKPGVGNGGGTTIIISTGIDREPIDVTPQPKELK